MKDINIPVLICWVWRVIKELLDKLFFLPDVDSFDDVPTLILVGKSAIDNHKTVHHITVSPSQQLRYLNH